MKGSPFKMRTPLYSHQEGHVKPGTIGTDKRIIDTDSGKGETPKTEPLQESNISLNNQEAKTDLYTDGTKASTLADQKTAAEAGKSKGSGNTMFDRDGRSVDKFDQRIADAKSKGKLGRVQRLKNRKGGYMESQANKLERAGGTLTDPQKRALNKAGEEAGGTNFGRGFRAFLNRDSKKERKVDPVSTSASDETSSGANESGLNTWEDWKIYEKSENEKGSTMYDTAQMFMSKKKTKKANKNSSSNGMGGFGVG